MQLDFEKWHGCRNDFIVLTLVDNNQDLYLGSLRRQSSRLCDRRCGIGADGILVLWTKKVGDVPNSLSIINSDGSLANNCGNGLRCAMGSIMRNIHASTNANEAWGAKGKGTRHRQDNSFPMVELFVEGIPMTLRSIGKSESFPLIAVDMPTPVLNDNLEWWETGKCELDRIMKKFEPKSSWESGGCEIGNKHLIVFTDSASRELMLEVGPALQINKMWDGINVHICSAKVPTEKDQAKAGQEVGGKLSIIYDVWVWERGAGETAACGSGAIAVGALHLSSGVEDRDQWVGIDMPGGRLYVKQEEANGPTVLAGLAEFVFEGKLNI